MKVLIAFSADLNEIGKTKDVPAAEAAVMVREGRAQFVSDKDAKTAAKATGTTPPPAAAS